MNEFRPEGLLTLQQSLDAVRRDANAVSPVWHLAKLTGSPEREVLYLLGLNEIEVFNDETGLAHIRKSDIRRFIWDH